MLDSLAGSVGNLDHSVFWQRGICQSLWSYADLLMVIKCLRVRTRIIDSVMVIVALDLVLDILRPLTLEGQAHGRHEAAQRAYIDNPEATAPMQT
jgi:hypothetical protein